MKLKNWIVMAALGAAWAGCATPPLPADPHLLDVVQDGQATKEAVVLKLGQPSAMLEGGRILTYRLGEQTGKGYFIREATATNWFGLTYSLVLVFDEHEVLQRHSVVPVR